MTPDVDRMRAAAGDLEELLGVALEMSLEPGKEALSPAQAEQVDVLVGSYMRLAGAALERFEEAARGA